MNQWRLSKEEWLDRKGARLRGAERTWDMVNVEGPLEMAGADRSREYFRIETANAQTLVVARSTGEKGMRRLFLVAVTESAS
jgi:hypothetical protein